MSLSIFFTREWPGPAIERLKTMGFDVEVWPEFDRPPTHVIRQRIEEGLFALVTTVEDPIEVDEIGAGGSDLGIVAQAGVGFDNLDVDGLTDQGVWVSNTPGVLDDATADLAFALLCSLARRIPEADRYVRDGRWTCWHPSLFLGKELSGATVGVVGLGRIGLAFARRCRGFDMEILYTARSPKVEADRLDARFASLTELLQTSDIVSLHVPLTEDTYGLINEQRLRMMKRDALLINTARGAVVDQRALLSALEEGWIGGAALDVTNPEPLPPNDPLLGAPNLVLAPHIGSAGVQTRSKMAVMAAENIVAVRDGNRPPNALNEIS